MAALRTPKLLAVYALKHKVPSVLLRMERSSLPSWSEDCRGLFVLGIV
jgi:hypothetical protein